MKMLLQLSDVKKVVVSNATARWGTR
uniref:Uncharacterized protein n=1 Tax=Lepeophtheirus salmonis TaxID=72036 RepID=A0A0K2VHC1_LEPSM